MQSVKQTKGTAFSTLLDGSIVTEHHNQESTTTTTTGKERDGSSFIDIKLFQRMPKQILHQYCQKNRRPRPCYNMASPSTAGMFRSTVMLPDSKNYLKTLKFATRECWPYKIHSEHYSALLALHHLEPTRPHEKILPEPFRTAWLVLIGDVVVTGASPPVTTSASLPTKGGKKSSSSTGGQGRDNGGGVCDPSTAGSSSSSPTVVSISRASWFSSVYELKQEIGRRKPLRGPTLGDRETSPTVTAASVVCRALLKILSNLHYQQTLREDRLVPRNSGDHQDTVRFVFSSDWVFPPPFLFTRNTGWEGCGALQEVDMRFLVRLLIDKFQFEVSDVHIAIKSLKKAICKDNNLCGDARRYTHVRFDVLCRLCLDFLGLNATAPLPSGFVRRRKQIELRVDSDGGVQKGLEKESGNELDMDEARRIKEGFSAAAMTWRKSRQIGSKLTGCHDAIEALGLFSLTNGWERSECQSSSETKYVSWRLGIGPRPQVLSEIEAIFDGVAEWDLFLILTGRHSTVDPDAIQMARENDRIAIEAIHPEVEWIEGNDFYLRLPIPKTVVSPDLQATYLSELWPHSGLLCLPPIKNVCVTCSSISLFACQNSLSPYTPLLLWFNLTVNDDQPIGESGSALLCAFLNFAMSLDIRHQLTKILENHYAHLGGSAPTVPMEGLFTESLQRALDLVRETSPMVPQKETRREDDARRQEAVRRWGRSLGITASVDIEGPNVPCKTGLKIDGSSTRINLLSETIPSSEGSDAKPALMRPLARREAAFRKPLTPTMAATVLRGAACKLGAESRQRLNSWQHFQELKDKTAGRNRVLIVQGETGCGKTTQIPRMLLELQMKRFLSNSEDCSRQTPNIVCVQPRRIAAISVAERVSAEFGERRVGGIVGYRVRLDSRVTSSTRITYCTNGVLLRELVDDNQLGTYSAVVLDEVHERSAEVDLLLLVLAEALQRNPKLLLVVMSASLNAALFEHYFKKIHRLQCATVSIRGRIFPVEVFYIDKILQLIKQKKNDQRADTAGGVEWADKNRPVALFEDDNTYNEQPQDPNQGGSAVSPLKPTATSRPRSFLDRPLPHCASLACDVVRHIHLNSAEKPGEEMRAVLVFVSGVLDIDKVCRKLEKLNLSLYVLPCHGSMPPEQQKKVFEKCTGRDRRKVVVATNVAETSITIDDVVYVVDTGTHKVSQYMPSKSMTCLVEEFISKASATQRAGRAGRVRAGECYRLYSEQRLLEQPEEDTAEMLRVPLENICLLVKAMFPNRSIEAVLQQCISQPSLDSIRHAIRNLIQLRCLSFDAPRVPSCSFDQQSRASSSSVYWLTPLGRTVSQLPMDARLGVMLSYSCLFGCLEDLLTVCAFMTSATPLLKPLDKREEADKAHRCFKAGECDFTAKVRIYNTWLSYRAKGRQSEESFCAKYFLHRGRLMVIRDLRRLYADSVVHLGLADPAAYSEVYRAIRSRQTDSLLTSTGEQRIAATDCGVYASSADNAIVRACITAGLYPNIVIVKMPPKEFQAMLGGAVEKVPMVKKLKFFSRCMAQESGEAVVSGHAEQLVESRGRLSESVEVAKQREEQPSNMYEDEIKVMNGFAINPAMPRLDRVFLHPSSFSFHAGDFRSPFLCFLERRGSQWMSANQGETNSKSYLVNTSSIFAYTLLLISGGEMFWDPVQGSLYLDGWIRIHCGGQVATFIRTLRVLFKAISDRFFCEVLEGTWAGPDVIAPRLCIGGAPESRSDGYEMFDSFFGGLHWRDDVCAVMEMVGLLIKYNGDVLKK